MTEIYNLSVQLINSLRWKPKKTKKNKIEEFIPWLFVHLKSDKVAVTVVKKGKAWPAAAALSELGGENGSAEYRRNMGIWF